MRICEIKQCENPYHAKGYCRTHYLRWKKHGDPNHQGRNYKGCWAGVTCKIEGCDNPVKNSGLCSKHRSRAQREKTQNEINRYIERVTGDV